MHRISGLQMYFKIGVLKNFGNFTVKHLCWSTLFNKVAGLKACKFVKKETPTQVLSCEISEIFKSNFFTEHLRRLLLNECFIIISVSNTRRISNQ